MTIWKTNNVNETFDYPFNEFDSITVEALQSKSFMIRKVAITPFTDLKGEKRDMCHMVITTVDDGVPSAPPHTTYVVRTSASNIVKFMKSLTEEQLRSTIEKLQPTHFVVTQLRENKREYNLA